MHLMRRRLNSSATRTQGAGNYVPVAERRLSSRPCETSTAHQMHVYMIDRLAAFFIAVHHYTVTFLGEAKLLG